MLEQLHQYDQSLLIYLNQLSGSFLDTFWVFVTQIYTWIPLFALLLFLVFKNHSGKQAVKITTVVVTTLVFVLLLTELTKEWVQRIRPNNNDEINNLIKVLQNPDNFSFFSGHASSSFAITTILFMVLRKQVKYIQLLFIWPLLFSSSRIFVGVHYPSDILVGVLVGIFFGFVFHRFLRYITR